MTDQQARQAQRPCESYTLTLGIESRGLVRRGAVSQEPNGRLEFPGTVLGSERRALHTHARFRHRDGRCVRLMPDDADSYRIPVATLGFDRNVDALAAQGREQDVLA